MKKVDKIKKINDQITELKNLTCRDSNDPNFKKWRRDTIVALEYIFGNESDQVSEFKDILFFSLSFNLYEEDEDSFQVFKDGSFSADAILNSMLKEIIEYGSGEEEVVSTIQIENSSSLRNDKIFIVHGHNEILREQSLSLLSTLELESIILHDQPNKGQTLIEKFESNSDVGYALILLTSDDIGCKKDEDYDKLSYRARQNVILELGFFLGKLGRDKVCVIYEEGVEIPSDYDGVVYIPVLMTMLVLGVLELLKN